ncbi:MAG: alpha-mannosidase [Clostridia bacterium]|nr:alpha-mannosidase [Clostridia bacterium]
MRAKLRKINQYFKLIKDFIYYGHSPIDGITICPCGYKKDNTPPPLSEFKPFEPCSPWGDGYDSHAWFHFTLNTPAVGGNDPILLFIDTETKKPDQIQSSSNRWDAVNPQFIIYINGEISQGFDVNHTYITVEGGQSYDIYLYGYVGPRSTESRLMAYTCRRRTDVQDLYFDIDAPLNMLTYLDERSHEYAMIVDYLDKTVSLLDLYEVGSEAFFESVARAKAYIRDEFYGKYCGKQPTTTLCVGHTHIDCAWLWTLDQTREKVQRSFATVLELMRRYPEYKFMSSQALLYKYLKEEAPEIYEGVREMIRAGRWECEGAMWVEADCNLSSGESLVRQVMYGKRFFKEEFGVDNRVLWLPDVFGYSAALPQILKKCGVDWFVTSKISWNDTNVMPYETFKWQGIDGTDINTYFLTACDVNSSGKATYNAHTHQKMVAGTYWRYGQKALSDEAMLTFGYGDGGGGPTPEFIEKLRRGAKGIPGAPNAEIGFAGDFLKRMEERIDKAGKLPKWQGELYLEYHRGTYTSIAKNKRNNRKSELLLSDAELNATLAGLLCGKPFPKAELHNAWETVLTNQFHDIIPGSSIREVYEQCDRDYAAVRATGEGTVDSAKAEIARGIDKKQGYVVFNPHSFVGNGFVKIDDRTAYVEGVAPKGYSCVADMLTENDVVIDGRTVETAAFRVEFDECWQISSIYDKRCGREIITEGQRANVIEIYPDHPDKYDNWEWQEYSLDEHRTLTAVESAETVEDGARRGIRITRPYSKSKITQTVWFCDHIARIDFETVADWHESHLMVKAAFPVDINADKATYEVQFGNVERPTHKNTSWDAAKFEVCAHKYADLSDNGYGVALMNDCKYGYDIHDGVMRLSLFKCGTYPNEVADQGIHKFTYSLMPHEGRLCDSDVLREAYYLNYPMTAVAATGDKSALPERFSVLTVDRDNVVCETVKQAEDSEDVIVRLYEAQNIRGRAKVTFGLPVKRVTLCDLMENELATLPVENNSVTLDVKGFEIVTLKLEF